ncbi:ribbon-helix-helix protein, CopG family [Candidatus Woesearchaeota archaeon]|nr:ribbon-helix-helix protein, CopG family [Candidatus Woesearchaeota archaeon]
METISLKLEKEFAEELQNIMRKHRYTTKTEFIREAMRERIKQLEKEYALIKLRNIYGSSKRKTSRKELDDAKDKAFEELEEIFR